MAHIPQMNQTGNDGGLAGSLFTRSLGILPRLGWIGYGAGDDIAESKNNGNNDSPQEMVPYLVELAMMQHYLSHFKNILKVY